MSSNASTTKPTKEEKMRKLKESREKAKAWAASEKKRKSGATTLAPKTPGKTPSRPSSGGGRPAASSRKKKVAMSDEETVEYPLEYAAAEDSDTRRRNTRRSVGMASSVAVSRRATATVKEEESVDMDESSEEETFYTPRQPAIKRRLTGPYGTVLNSSRKRKSVAEPIIRHQDPIHHDDSSDDSEAAFNSSPLNKKSRYGSIGTPLTSPVPEVAVTSEKKRPVSGKKEALQAARARARASMGVEPDRRKSSAKKTPARYGPTGTPLTSPNPVTSERKRPVSGKKESSQSTVARARAAMEVEPERRKSSAKKTPESKFKERSVEESDEPEEENEAEQNEPSYNSNPAVAAPITYNEYHYHQYPVAPPETAVPPPIAPTVAPNNTSLLNHQIHPKPEQQMLRNAELRRTSQEDQAREIITTQYPINQSSDTTGFARHDGVDHNPTHHHIQNPVNNDRIPNTTNNINHHEPSHNSNFISNPLISNFNPPWDPNNNHKSNPTHNSHRDIPINPTSPPIHIPKPNTAWYMQDIPTHNPIVSKATKAAPPPVHIPETNPIHIPETNTAWYMQDIPTHNPLVSGATKAAHSFYHAVENLPTLPHQQQEENEIHQNADSANRRIRSYNDSMAKQYANAAAAKSEIATETVATKMVTPPRYKQKHEREEQFTPAPVSLLPGKLSKVGIGGTTLSFIKEEEKESDDEIKSFREKYFSIPRLFTFGLVGLLFALYVSNSMSDTGSDTAESILSQISKKASKLESHIPPCFLDSPQSDSTDPAHSPPPAALGALGVVSCRAYADPNLKTGPLTPKPCPKHGKCSNGFLRDCDTTYNEPLFRVSKTHESCIMSNTSLQFLEELERILVDRTVENICGWCRHLRYIGIGSTSICSSPPEIVDADADNLIFYVNGLFPAQKQRYMFATLSSHFDSSMFNTNFTKPDQPTVGLTPRYAQSSLPVPFTCYILSSLLMTIITSIRLAYNTIASFPLFSLALFFLCYLYLALSKRRSKIRRTKGLIVTIRQRVYKLLQTTTEAGTPRKIAISHIRDTIAYELHPSSLTQRNQWMREVWGFVVKEVRLDSRVRKCKMNGNVECWEWIMGGVES